MAYRLLYFPFRGRGEQIRLLFHALEIEYEDVAIEKPTLMELKKQGPEALLFGSVPVLEDGDFKLAQGPAILSYLGRKHGAAPTDPELAAQADAVTLGAEDLRSKYFGLFGDQGAEKQAAFVAGDWTARWLPAFEWLLSTGSDAHLVGDSLSYADIAVWDALDSCVTYVDGANFDEAPRLKAFYDAIAARASLSAYLKYRAD
jgi:glutathione S-transferase